MPKYTNRANTKKSTAIRTGRKTWIMSDKTSNRPASSKAIWDNRQYVVVGRKAWTTSRSKSVKT